MQIRVRCECGAADSCKEWAIVELQGSLEVQNNADLHNLNIGSLCRKGKDKFVFTVGYHELEGTRIALKKPLLVLDQPAAAGDAAGDADARAMVIDGSPQLNIIGIIRHKILFKSRPRAIITKPEVKVKKPRPAADAFPAD